MFSTAIWYYCCGQPVVALFAVRATLWLVALFA